MRADDDAALLIGFLNTLHVPDGVDVLAGSSPTQWLEHGRDDDGRSLHASSNRARPEARRRDLGSLLVLREGLRAMLFRGYGSGPEADPATRSDAVARADRALGFVPLVLSIGGEVGVPTLKPARRSSSDDPLATVATAVLRAHVNGALIRVKVCARPTCRWAFFDASRNRSRHWCSMAGCGNAEKNRAYRARRFTP
jgi:predicted RNA-binding Zn ribbon-like protein